MSRPRLLVLAGGGKEPTEGGTGFKNLKLKERIVGADIVAVASHHARGGVSAKARELGVPFTHFPSPYTAERYQGLVRHTRADIVACLGWVKPVRGLNPATTINTHNGLPPFIGRGMFGTHTHEATMAAYARGEVTEAGFFMHFVTDFDADGDYDRGPEFFRLVFPIRSMSTPDSHGWLTRSFERLWQPEITNLIVTRQIRWSGRRGDPVLCPRWYRPVQRG
ncbi:MAG: hypothetical protein Q7S95_01125 [bacterium]|nr:hypothetical protein [bacterium]